MKTYLIEFTFQDRECTESNALLIKADCLETAQIQMIEWIDNECWLILASDDADDYARRNNAKIKMIREIHYGSTEYIADINNDWCLNFNIFEIKPKFIKSYDRNYALEVINKLETSEHEKLEYIGRLMKRL